MKPKLTHKQKRDKLVDDLDYLTTAEIDALLATTKAFKENSKESPGFNRGRNCV